MPDITPEDEETRWARERAIMSELQAQRDKLAAEERARAYAAVSAALATYRWWGWTNIVNTLRVMRQAVRQRLARHK